MPQISYFVFCENIQPINNPINSAPKPALFAPITVLTPQFIPSEYSFSCAFGLIGVDVKRDNIFQIKILSPKKDVIQDMQDIPVPRSTGPITLPEKYWSLQMTMDFRNLPILEIGDYSIEVYLNGDLIDTHTIGAYPGNVNVLK